jgi:hypothetical protein
MALAGISAPAPKRIDQKSSRSRAELPIGVCRQDGKEAKRMGSDAKRQRGASASDRNDVSHASPGTVKVTLHLTVGTAQRLGVESAMRRISQSAIAEEVLAAYLSRWQLPAVADLNRPEAG